MCFCLCHFVHIIVIPNAEAIQAARRKRSAIRAQKEFIPFSKDGQSSAGSTPDHYSKEDDEDRIDDDDDEPDDHERRIEFAPRHKTIKERIAEKLGSRVKFIFWHINDFSANNNGNMIYFVCSVYYFECFCVI